MCFNDKKKRKEKKSGKEHQKNFYQQGVNLLNSRRQALAFCQGGFHWLPSRGQSKIDIQEADGKMRLKGDDTPRHVLEGKHDGEVKRHSSIYIYIYVLHISYCSLIYTAVNQTKSSFRTESRPVYQEPGDNRTHFLSATESLQIILSSTRWQCWSTLTNQISHPAEGDAGLQLSSWNPNQISYTNKVLIS